MKTSRNQKSRPSLLPRYWAVLLTLLVACAGLTCSSATRKAGADPYWNDVARYLAGLPVREESVLRPFTLEPAYQAHVKFMNDLFQRIQKETIDLLHPWQNSALPATGLKTTAFYPLSGADFINLYCLYPGAQRYLMIAMEQPGDATLLRDTQSRRLIDGLVPVQRSIYLYGIQNYFQSKVMEREMNNLQLPGTIAPLLIFMTRLGNTITQVENVTIDDHGRCVELHSLAGAAAPEITGLRIHFIKEGEKTPVELVYLSMMLGPDSASPTTPAGRYLGSLKNIQTMLKSAVFLLHNDRFAPLRDFILQRSRIIVQDDSGIPYRSFSPDWNISLYGVYRPEYKLSGCTVTLQNDLSCAFLKESAPLPFPFGYGILLGPNKSNLLIARKPR